MLRVSNRSADRIDADNNSSTLSYGGEAGLGGHLGVGFARQDPLQPGGQLSAFVKFGIGVGVSFGSWRIPLDSFNSGYLGRW